MRRPAGVLLLGLLALLLLPRRPEASMSLPPSIPHRDPGDETPEPSQGPPPIPVHELAALFRCGTCSSPEVTGPRPSDGRLWCYPCEGIRYPAA